MTRAIAFGLCALLLARESAAQTPPSGALAAVVQLYRDYAWAAVVDTPELSTPDVAGEPRATLARYFDDGLVALILKDRACSARTHEVCNLDFSPIWDSQDPVGITLQMSRGRNATTVLVKLHMPGGSEVRQLTYTMTQTAAGWRVHDIAYDSHASLVSMLRGKS